MSEAKTLSIPGVLSGVWRACVDLVWDQHHSRSSRGIAVDAFTRAAGVPKDMFKQVVIDDLDVDKASVFHPFGAEDGFFRVKYAGKKFRDKYDLDFNNGVVLPGDMRSERGDRGTGRQMFALRAVTGLFLRFTRLELYAAHETGAYVWARAGVRVDSGERERLRDDMRRRLEAVSHRLTGRVYNQAWRLTELKHDDDLRRIADLPTQLHHVALCWDEVRTQERSDVDFAFLRKHGFVQGHSMTLGQFLLYTQCYNAHVDLTDARQMDQIERYTRTPIRAMAAARITQFPRKAF